MVTISRITTSWSNPTYALGRCCACPQRCHWKIAAKYPAIPSSHAIASSILLVPSPAIRGGLAATTGCAIASLRAKATKPVIPKAIMDAPMTNNPIKNLIGVYFQAKKPEAKIGMLNKISDKLAAIAQPLPEALPFLTVHQAIPLSNATNGGNTRIIMRSTTRKIDRSLLWWIAPGVDDNNPRA